MTWNRKLWGVEFSSLHPASLSKSPMLIGSHWRKEKSIPFPDEPSRALLFCTRAAARKWCADQMAENRTRTDSLRLWKFRPVRVVEIVRKVKP